MSNIQSKKQIFVDKISSTVLIGLSLGETIVVAGKYNLNVICGDIEVLGKVMTKCLFLGAVCKRRDRPYFIESPNEDNALVLKASGLSDNNRFSAVLPNSEIVERVNEFIYTYQGNYCSIY